MGVAEKAAASLRTGGEYSHTHSRPHPRHGVAEKRAGGIWNTGQEIIRDPFLGFQNFKFFLCVMLRGKCGMVLVGNL